MARKAVTIKDVAALAGVGVTTVSRVVRGEEYVAAATRERVEQAIAELGFQPNSAAQALRPGQRTRTIALLIEDVANPFYGSVAEGVEKIAATHDTLVLLGVTGRDADRERDLILEMLRRRVDGLLLVPGPHDHSALAERLSDVPIVFIDRPATGLAGDVVRLANFDGAKAAVELLVGHGHRRIGYLGGETYAAPGSRRLAGYRAALADAGIVPDPLLVRDGNTTMTDASKAASALLGLDEPITALFCDNNLMTAGALYCLGQVQRGDVEIAGFDELGLADLVPQRLSLVTHDDVAVGQIAARLLFERIEGSTRPFETVRVPTAIRSAASYR